MLFLFINKIFIFNICWETISRKHHYFIYLLVYLFVHSGKKVKAMAQPWVFPHSHFFLSYMFCAEAILRIISQALELEVSCTDWHERKEVNTPLCSPPQLQPWLREFEFIVICTAQRSETNTLECCRRESLSCKPVPCSSECLLRKPVHMFNDVKS